MGCNELLALAILVKVSYAQLVFLTCTELQGGGGDMSECCNLKLKLIACSVPQRITPQYNHTIPLPLNMVAHVQNCGSNDIICTHYSVYNGPSWHMKCKSASRVYSASPIPRLSPSSVCVYSDTTLGGCLEAC